MDNWLIPVLIALVAIFYAWNVYLTKKVSNVMDAMDSLETRLDILKDRTDEEFSTMNRKYFETLTECMKLCQDYTESMNTSMEEERSRVEELFSEIKKYSDSSEKWHSIMLNEVDNLSERVRSMEDNL